MVQWHKNDLENRMYINVGDGKKAAMPRYFKEKIYNSTERVIVSVHQQQKIIQKTLDEFSKNDPSYFKNKSADKKHAMESLHLPDTKNKV